MDIEYRKNEGIMIREVDLAFIKIHILYHAAEEEVYGVGLIEELARHGYRLSPGTLYPTLAKMVRLGLLTFECRTVVHKQRKYYRITPDGLAELDKVKDKIVELYEEVLEKV
jgi:PadR family transcriptional regulator PadR